MKLTNLIPQTCRPFLVITAAGILMAGGASNALAYNGSLNTVFGDLKQSLLGTGTQLTTGNAVAVVDGLWSNMHCNGIRLPIDMTSAHPGQVSADPDPDYAVATYLNPAPNKGWLY